MKMRLCFEILIKVFF